MNRRFSAALLTGALLAGLTLPAGALSVEDARSLLEARYVDSLPAPVYEAQSLDALLEALGDPYTVYYTPEAYEKFLASVNGDELVGIGITLRTTFFDGFEILSTLPDSPAQRAGLIPGEKITAIDGHVLAPDDNPTTLITGEEGTPVTLTLHAPDGTVRDVTLIRARVLLPIFSYELKGSAGVLICDSFGESAPGAVKAALTELAGQTSTWIMDLRDNPGGTSTAAAEMAGYFLGSKLMVHFRDADGNDYRTSTITPDLTSAPLIILTSARSASASELFSSAIRDHSGGIAIGERTHGKGVAQTVFDSASHPDLFGEDAFKVTTYRFFSPDGATNHLMGVLPTLLMPQEYAASAAAILSAPKPQRSLHNWKLELAGHTFYFDREAAAADPEALTLLLEALPPSARLLRGTGTDYWRQTDAAEMVTEFGLTDYTPRVFSDVAGHPYEREINTLRTYELLAGTGDGLFRPDNTLTRAELAAILTTALDLPESNMTFSDVAPDAWYAGAASAVAARGFMQGTGDETFSPDAVVTNQELYTAYSALAAWASMEGYEWSKKDVSAVQWAKFYEYPEWAQSHVRNLDQLGLSVDAEHPTASVTRGYAAGLLCNLFENLHFLWNE